MVGIHYRAVEQVEKNPQDNMTLNVISDDKICQYVTIYIKYMMF